MTTRMPKMHLKGKPQASATWNGAEQSEKMRRYLSRILNKSPLRLTPGVVEISTTKYSRCPMGQPPASGT